MGLSYKFCETFKNLKISENLFIAKKNIEKLMKKVLKK